ncbi:outer membrane beta-barrel protein [Agitococcus lubricus]|uniref:Beta-barrel porin 2 n=1 Tax=Agitococcus lubricus TaxID=1077255 RepID=A0A2T5IYR2_9GAMM|nr:outer membrane beta-barrel protein [Agitococcus lubricus]PTQ89077.1 hypothetical protein C8N29_109100 [Agitococcus lubricus]
MESKKSVGVSGLGLALLLGAQGAMAQVAVQPQAIPFGSFVLVPALVTQTVYDDNVYNTHTDEVSSFYQTLNPSFAFIAQDRLNVYSATYAINAASYANDSDDSYADQLFDLKAHIESNARLRFDLGANYAMTHDARGVGFTSGSSLTELYAYGEVDKFDLATLSAGVEYGAKDARGLLRADVSTSQKRYDRELVAKARDNDSMSASVGLRARLMPKTQFLIDIEHATTEYESSSGSPDSTDNRIFAGIEWKGTAQTTGKLRLGQSKREVDGLDDKSKFSWDVDVIWQPRQFDSINLNSGNRLSDATLPYVSLENTHYGVSWKHDWAERLNTVVSLGFSTDDYEAPAGVKNRTDDSSQYGVSVNYQMRRWLIWNASIQATDRSSDVQIYDTKRNVMSVGAQISL